MILFAVILYVLFRMMNPFGWWYRPYYRPMYRPFMFGPRPMGPRPMGPHSMHGPRGPRF